MEASKRKRTEEGELPEEKFRQLDPSSQTEIVTAFEKTPFDVSKLLALLTETSEESSRLAIPEPTSQLWGVNRKSYTAYIRWRRDRQYQLKHPFPPGVVISLSLARLFVSPNFKLVSHMPRDAVRAIMSAFSGIVGKRDLQLPNQVVMAFARSTTDRFIVGQIEHTNWSIVYMDSQDIATDRNRIYLGLEGGRNIDRAFLVYGLVEPIPKSIDVGPSAIAGLSTLQQMFKLFWSDGSTTGDARGLERVPSQNMLSYRNMIAVIPATMKYLFGLGITMMFITTTKRSDRTEQNTMIDVAMPESISVDSAIIKAIERMIISTQPMGHTFETVYYERLVLMEDYDIHIDMGVDLDHKIPIYEHTWEGTSKHERYFIDREAMLIPTLRSKFRDFIGPLRVFDPTTPWGKPWEYQRSFYLPAPSRPVKGLLIIPLPWLFFLYNPDIPIDRIILSKYQFDLDLTIMAIHRLPGTGRILAFQPYECIFLMDQLPPEETERLALLQRPEIKERARSQILAL